jgi:AraC-like DNA-binding protein
MIPGRFAQQLEDLSVQLEEPGVAISALRRAVPLALAADTAASTQGSPLLSWSTAEVDQKDRFDYWRTVRAKGLFGATAELEPEQRPRFQGEFSLRKFGSAGLIKLRASPYHVERSLTDIADGPSNSLCIYQQLGGGGWFRVGRSDDFSITGGNFATGHSDLPYHAVPLAADGFDFRVLKVPVADISGPITGLRDLVVKPFGDHAQLGPLLESCFADLTEAGDDGDPATAKAMVRTVTQLALIERGIVRPRSRAAQYAIRAGRLSLARRLIASHIAQAQLAPAFVANLLGISVRHLHVLFEDASQSFAQTVTALRIERSRQLLREAPAMTIAEIALASGFDSIATFYRVFRALQGITPGDFRDATIRTTA